jgi:hypothetical protein
MNGLEDMMSFYSKTPSDDHRGSVSLVISGVGLEIHICPI